MQNANNYDELLDRATQAVLDQAPQDIPPEELILATRKMVEQVQQVGSVTVAPVSQRNVGRWSIAVLAVAASLLAIVVPFFSSSSAFAQAIEKLKNVGAFRYKELVYLTTQEKPVEIQVEVADDGRERKSMLGMVSIHDSTGQLRLSFNEAAKSATVHVPMEGLAVESERQIKWLERLKSYGKKPDKELGSMKIDGRDCLGFEVKPVPSAVYAVWVDAKTSDLVQVEFKGMPKGSSVTKSVMKDFEFNLTLDPMLFSFDAPQGYQSSTAAKLPELLPFEESLVEVLKGYTELSGGKFPKSITDSAEWMTILSKDGVPRTTLAARLGTLTPYLVGMSHDDYDYTGAGKEVDGKRSIVFWYRNPEKQLRAVYSDFTVATIADADLPKK